MGWRSGNIRGLRRGDRAALVVTVLAVMAAAGATPAKAAGVPASTSSFYVYGSFVDACGPGATTECPLYNDAATEAVPAAGGMTILDFGAPCFEPATLAWGTQLFNSQSCTPDTALVTLAQAWLRGYEVNPHRAGSAGYVLAIGTSNSLTAAVPGNALSSAAMTAHGQARFTSVIAPLVAAAQGMPSLVTIWAGNDIEQSSSGDWYDGPTTSAWVDSYAAASGASKPCVPTRSGLMVDYGDYVPNQPGWSPAARYHVAWQAAAACPMPEIYFAVNADEWQSVNRYALSADLPEMQFTGVLSQDGAAGSLTSSESWSALATATGQVAPYLSVVGVTGPVRAEVPDAPTAVTAVAGPGVAVVGWVAPAWDGGAAVTKYTVTVYAGSTRVQLQEFSGFPAPEQVLIAGLRSGVTYRFLVTATNRVGTGPQSLASNGLTPKPPPLMG